MKKSKIISEETVFESKHFWVKKTIIERDGKQFTKDILERSDTVVVLALNEKDEIYLVYQYRDGLQKFLLELPAGNMEGGDSPLEGAKRELHEETGLKANKWKKIITLLTSANIKGDVHIFLATELEEGRQDLNDDEDIKVIKLPFAQALEKIEAGEIQAGSNIAALLLLDKMIKEGKV